MSNVEGQQGLFVYAYERVFSQVALFAWLIRHVHKSEFYPVKYVHANFIYIEYITNWTVVVLDSWTSISIDRYSFHAGLKNFMLW